jgi:predicted RNA-binding protein YlqC (UPF0109 family)
VKELVQYIAQSLVDDPAKVEVNEIEENGNIRVELRVAKDDMGRIIGKGGRVANSIRVLLRVAAAREGKRVSLDVLEP